MDFRSIVFPLFCLLIGAAAFVLIGFVLAMFGIMGKTEDLNRSDSLSNFIYEYRKSHDIKR